MEEQRTHISQGKAEAFLVCDKSLGDSRCTHSFHGFVVRDLHLLVTIGIMGVTGRM